MKIPVYIASDHGGFELKDMIIEFVKGMDDFEITDLGPFEYQEWDDYPDYVIPLANRIQDEPEAKGILICKNGIGVSIAANKYRDVRAGLCCNDSHARSAVKDDDINVVALPANYVKPEEIKEIVQAFLETEFSEQERHIRRLDKVDDIERRNFK